MDRLSQRNLNEAAEKVADVYREALASGAPVWQLHADITRLFFDLVLDNLYAQPVSINQRSLQSLAELARDQQETFRELSRESLNAYMGFLEALGSYGRAAIGTSDRASSKDPRPRLPLFSGNDPTLARRFEEELYGFGK